MDKRAAAVAPKQLILDVHRELIVDLFAGGGGMSTAFELALGRSPDIAINHNDDALSMHRANHPQTRHFIADVYEVCPKGATQGRPVGWLHLSPDCFPAGTMVLTRDGYRRIEEIQIGDEVLTHKLRWRKVTSTLSAVKPLMEVRGQGHPGLLVSPEHPFYVRKRRDVWQTSPRGYLRTLEAVEWKTTRELDKGWYWASPGNFPASEVPQVPIYRSRSLSISESLFWLAGLYVADGWTRLTDTRAELVITCGKHEVERVRVALNKWPRDGGRSVAEEMTWTERATGTAYQFATSHKGLVEWLRTHFGHGAAEKLIPGWALGMDKVLRQSFLDGYLSGDGCNPKCDGSQLVTCTTVSKALAFGLKALATSLGHAPAVYVRHTQPDVIQGRKVNVLPAWSVRWRPDRERAQSFYEDGMDWAPVREVRTMMQEAEVFNISVDEDESYVVEGVVVHNCTHHSQAAGGQPRSKKIRGLSWVGYRWAGQVAPRVISLENVPQILKWGPLIAKRDKATGRVIKLDKSIAAPGERVPVNEQYLLPDPKREGQTWKRFTRALENLGYKVKCDVSVAADLGGHTTRKRLFMVARRDGVPIAMPKQTHAKIPSKGLAKWKPAADCLDWDIPCPSIFSRKKPLADATHRRIARGIVQYVLNNTAPFIVPIAHYNGRDTAYSTGEPLRTITAATKGGEFALATPVIVPATHQGGDRVHSLQEPLRTVTGAQRGELMLSAPLLAKFRHDSTGAPIDGPMPTITSGGNCARPAGAPHALGLIAPTLVQAAHGDGQPGRAQRWGTGATDITRPLGTTTASGGHAIAAATLVQTGYGEREGQAPRCLDIKAPLGTAVGTVKHAIASTLLVGVGDRAAQSELTDAGQPVNTCTSSAEGDLVTGFMAQMNGGFCETAGHSITAPLSTVTNTGSQQQLVTAHLAHLRGNCDARAVDEPLRTVSAGGEHHAVVAATLVTNTTGHGATALSEPTPTVTTGNHHGVAAAFFSRYCTDDANRCRGLQDPAPTITAEYRLGLIECRLSPEDEAGALRVAAFLIRYYGEGGQWSGCDKPFPTMTTKDRLALVTVVYQGTPYVITDIGLRMLQPRELFRGQDFPAHYIINHGHDGRIFSKSAQVRMVGNSVDPVQAMAYIKANAADMSAIRRAA